MKDLKLRQKRYSMMFGIISIVHIVYLLIFMLEKIKPLINLNVFFVVIYLLLSWWSIKSHNFIRLLTICSVCIGLNTVTGMFLLGLDYGYQYMFIGIVPVIFCLAYFDNNSLKNTIIIASIVFISFIISNVICSLLHGDRFKLGILGSNLLVFVNMLISFSVSSLFMILLIKQVSIDTGLLQNQKADIELSASMDTLTGLRNRRSLDEYLDRAFLRARGEGKTFTILMCDIDNFKTVNDTYGHECGDLVLKNIAQILSQETRGDDIVFRWGGEEILILINGNDYIARKIAERCRLAIESSRVSWEGIEVGVTITIGGASYFQGSTDKVLMERADSNLYYGKTNGKNQVVL